MIVKMSKLLAVTSILLLLSSLLSSVQVVAGENNQGKEYEENIWQNTSMWANMTIKTENIRVEISTVGLFGLTLERPYALISFELKPKGDNYLGRWVKVKYEGLSGEGSRKLSFDETNGIFYFPLTQISLDSSAWTSYPFNSYRAQFKLSGENISFSESGEKITDTPVLLLKSKINWEKDTISVEMERDISSSIVQLLLCIMFPFLLVFLCSMAAFKKSTKKRASLKEFGGFFISFVAAIGFVYTILAGFNMELMPISSLIFIILIVLGIVMFYFRTHILEGLSKIQKRL